MPVGSLANFASDRYPTGKRGGIALDPDIRPEHYVHAIWLLVLSAGSLLILRDGSKR
jgi:hypothetical protein